MSGDLISRSAVLAALSRELSIVDMIRVAEIVESVPAVCEDVHLDWYQRLSDLDYDYHPEPNGEPWYQAKDVWACIEEEPKDV